LTTEACGAAASTLLMAGINLGTPRRLLDGLRWLAWNRLQTSSLADFLASPERCVLTNSSAFNTVCAALKEQ
jgi:hypothetical protein